MDWNNGARPGLVAAGAVATVCALLAALAVACAPQPKAEARKPNIVVILADDLGYADVGFHGCQDIPTPNLDALARSGVRFTNGYVSHSFCSPSRAGLLTGRYQQRFGHEYNVRYGAGEGLPLSETLLPARLAEAGYVSGIAGKWHLGDSPEYHPLERGFNEFYGFLGGGHRYFESRDSAGSEYFIPLHRNREPEPVREYLTHAFSREAAAFVERHQAEPFFLYLAYNAPHTPLEAPEDYLARFSQIADEKRRTYAAMIAAVDDGVGLLLGRIHDLGLDEQTLIFFLSDNGGPPWANASRNDPLRGTKGQVYEGGIRVPFVAAWKGRLPAGTTFDHPVISLDIFATAMALAGLEPSAERPLDGVNLIPYLTGEQTGRPHERLYWRQNASAPIAIRDGNHKYLKMRPESAFELYDLGKDIGESTDLAIQEKARAGEIQQRLEAWNGELVAPVWPGTSNQPRRRVAR